MKTHIKLMQPAEYLHDLISEIEHAKSRVYLLALVISDEAETRHLIQALEDAARRGVRVSVASDMVFTYRELGVAGRKKHYVRTQLGRMRSMRTRLERAGARVIWLGQHGITLYSRRTHAKWSVVDDVAYAFGGVNLYSVGLDNLDYMFRVDDPSLADHLASQQDIFVRENKSGRTYPSHDYGMGDNITLIDGGMIGDSIIYRHARRLAARAERIIYVSQYAPTGRLGKLIRATEHELYYNRAADVEIFGRTLIRWMELIRGSRSLYTRPGYLHAKFMIFIMPDGERVAITGSHNFLAGNAIAGAREIALETRDPRVIDQLMKFLDEHVR